MMKKLVFAVDRMSTGGAERVVAALSNYIVTLPDYEVHVVTYSPKEDNEYPLDNRIVRHAYKPYSGGRLKGIISRYKFLKCIKDIEPYAVISLGTPRMTVMLSAAMMHRKFPLILSERNDPARFPEENIFRTLRDRAYKQCDGLVFQTQGAKEYFPEAISGKGVVICNPLTATLPDRYLGEREKNIVNFCRFVPQKNLSMLIKSFAKIHKDYPDYRLVLYGDGPEKDQLVQLSKELNIENSVIFPGYSNDIHKDIIKATMFVSSSDYEGISNSMLEAMAIGLPTICTDCPPGGARDTIRTGENGIIVPVGDVDQMALAIKSVISDSELAEKLSLNGSLLKDELQIERIACKWLNYIEYVKSNGKRS